MSQEVANMSHNIIRNTIVIETTIKEDSTLRNVVANIRDNILRNIGTVPLKLVYWHKGCKFFIK